MRQAAWMGLLAALAWPGAAAAHPHVWIDNRATLEFDKEGRITSVLVHWTFDELYSAGIVVEADTDGNGKPSPAELEAFGATMLKNLAEWNYFTELEADGKRVALGTARAPRMTHDGKALTFAFQVPLRVSVDPRKARAALRVFDPSFYVDIDYAAKDPIKLAGNAPEGCKVRIRDPDQMSAAVRLSEAYLASLDGTEGVGAMFARVAELQCG